MANYRNAQTSCGNYRQAQPQIVVPSCPQDPIEDLPLAMAYVPWQTWRELYDAEKGFCVGTIFKELNLPFLGRGGVR